MASRAASLLPALLAVLAVCVVGTAGQERALARLRVTQFVNPNSKMEGGGNCDSVFSSGCDVFFVSCLAQKLSDVSAASTSYKCTLAGQQRSQYTYLDRKSFAPDAEFFFPLSSLWPIPAAVRLDAWDEDGIYSSDELLVRTGTVVNVPANSGWQTFTHPAAPVGMTWQLRVDCNENFCGDSCELYCKSGEFGFYTCDSSCNKICNPGFTGPNCLEDIDACALNPCGSNATCADTPAPAPGQASGRVCTCLDGFDGNPEVGCVERFPCRQDLNNCHPDAFCLEMDGVAQCICQTGFAGNGTVCLRDCGPMVPDYPTAATLTSAGQTTTLGSTLQLACAEPGFLGSAPETFTCTANGRWAGFYPICVRNSSLPALFRPTEGAPYVQPLPDVFSGPQFAKPEFVYDAGQQLPAGMTWSPDTGLGGVPEVSGRFELAWEMRLPNRSAALRLPNMVLSIAPPIVSGIQEIITAQGRPFESSSWTFAGGTQPLKISTGGTLPPGLNFTVQPTGVVLEGIPSTLGTFGDLYIQAEDPNFAFQRIPLEVRVVPSLNVTWVREEIVPNGEANQNYELLAPGLANVTGGVGEIKFEGEGGLPSGLSVDGETGGISGVPQKAGDYVFNIVVKDKTGARQLVEILLLKVTPPADTRNASNGPNGRGCANGVPFDAVAFDGKFTCNCSAGWTGANCDTLINSGGKNNDNSGESEIHSGLVAGMVVGISILGLIVAVLIYVYSRQRKKASIHKKKAMHVVSHGDGGFVPPPPDEWEVDRRQLVFGDKLGEGAFGVVYAGTARKIRDLPPNSQVAIKQCSGDSVTNEERWRFIREAQLMKRLSHPNVVRMLGTSFQQEPMLLVVELAANGDLRSFLRHHHEVRRDLLIHMALDITSGLVYLAAENIVHRDLAARNCLVTDTLQVKLSDFGLGRETVYKEYYRVTGPALLPVRWMAPESFRTGSFTAASDVWSLGVVYWELMTWGSMPYEALGNAEVMEKVQTDFRLPMPPGCPPSFYQLMRQCWEARPELRPSAAQVRDRLLAQTMDTAIDTYSVPIPVATQQACISQSMHSPISSSLCAQAGDSQAASVDNREYFFRNTSEAMSGGIGGAYKSNPNYHRTEDDFTSSSFDNSEYFREALARGAAAADASEQVGEPVMKANALYHRDACPSPKKPKPDSLAALSEPLLVNPVFRSPSAIDSDDSD